MVSFGAQAGGELAATDLDDLEVPLMGRQWIRAFPGTYVCFVKDADDYSELLASVTEAVRDAGAHLFFLMSPPIATRTGRYNGLLIPNLWPPINSLTDRSPGDE